MTSQLTMSETLESLLTDRKILLFRYDANLRKEIFKKLTALQKQLLTRVSAAGIESISKSELQSLLKDVKTLIADTYTDVNAYSSKELNALLPIETDATAKIYNESVQFDLFNIVPERTLNAAKNADLIAGTPLKDWWAKQGDDLAFKFSALIRQGMIDGKQTSRLITETKDLLAHSRRGAETLVRTAVMKVHDKAQELFKDENLDLLKGEKHLSTLDTRTSEICRVRDGLAWDLDKKPIGEHAVPYARPPLHPNCRSTLILITKSWKELGLDMDEIPESTRASMDGQVKAGLTYENWLKNKTPEQQDAILGKGKADLWRQGVITFRDMLDQSGRPLTLKQLSVKFASRVEENNSEQHIPKELPKDFQSVIAIGRSIFDKYANIIDNAMANRTPHHAIMEIMQREGVELDGLVNVVGVEKKAITEITEAVKRYPKSWVEKSNELGKIFVRESKERSYHKYINIDSHYHLLKRYPLLKKGDLYKSAKIGDSLILADKTAEQASRLSTHVHEYGHRLQTALPDLDNYFVEFWKEHTKNDKVEKLAVLLSDPRYKDEITKKDHFPHPYYGKIYGSEYNPQPKEMLTMTFEAMLGGNFKRFDELLSKNPDLFDLGLGLLTRYK